MAARTKAQSEAETTALIDPATEAQGNAKATGGNLRRLEHIVENNAIKGAALWRKAADALLEIRDRKLWKLAKAPAGTDPAHLKGDGSTLEYKNFAAYAEARFGFKKTYAYDLVKAATRKPEALTEGEARAELKAERGVAPLTREQAVEKFTRAFQRFEDSAGDTRDRSIEDDELVRAYDKVHGQMERAWAAFLSRFVTIEGTSEEVTPDVQPE